MREALDALAPGGSVSRPRGERVAKVATRLAACPGAAAALLQEPFLSDRRAETCPGVACRKVAEELSSNIYHILVIDAFGHVSRTINDSLQPADYTKSYSGLGREEEAMLNALSLTFAWLLRVNTNRAKT